MAELFFSFGGQNYAKYLTYFGVFFANLDASHPSADDLLRLSAFSVARSMIPGNRCDVNKTMRYAKSRGGGAVGVSGILTNFSSYQR